MYFANVENTKAIREIRNSLRGNRGSSLLEVPVSLWITLVLMFMPMVSLASITLRSTLFNVAVQDAVQDAAKARTFEQASQAGPDAKTLSKTIFFNRALAFSGLQSTGIKLSIVQVNINNGSSAHFESKLSVPADTSKFIYQIEGSAIGLISPLLPGNFAIFGEIPGLTKEIPVQFTARQMAENPQGLNR